MARDDLANQVGFLIVELRPSGAQQNSFASQAEGEDLADQRWVCKMVCVSLASLPV